MDKLMVFLVLTVMCISGSGAFAETIHVDSRYGSDANSGDAGAPLKSIARAVELVNESSGPGPTIIKIALGIYVLERQCLIDNERPYTESTRLIVEAELLPGDPGWTAASMPVIMSAEYAPPASGDGMPPELSGLKVEIDHVTIRGLKFIGHPSPKIFYYPIFREGKALDDLVVSQCLFLCDRHVATMNVAVLANGHGLRINHSIFYNCANAVVFWNAEGGVSRGNAMTRCIVDGGYMSGVWLCETGEDLEFHHNVITNCKYAWMRSEGNSRTYRLNDCIINAFQHYSGKSSPSFEFGATGPEISYTEDKVIKTGSIQLDKGEGLDLDLPERYLHVVEGSPGFDLGTGLFMSGR